MIVSVIVLNEIVGPMLLKESLKRAGEANLPGDLPEKGPVRDALILGVELQSLALARKLQEHNWRVVIVDTDAEHVEKLAAEDIDERHVAAINEETLSQLITADTDFEFIQCTVTNPDLDDMLVRDLRLPNDVRILGVKRNGHSILPSGYTPIHLADDLTLIGVPDGLEVAMLRLGY